MLPCIIFNNSVDIVFALNVQTTVYNGMIKVRDIDILITYVILSYFFPQHGSTYNQQQ